MTAIHPHRKMTLSESIFKLSIVRANLIVTLPLVWIFQAYLRKQVAEALAFIPRDSLYCTVIDPSVASTNTVCPISEDWLFVP